MNRTVRPNTTVTIKKGVHKGAIATVVECWNRMEGRYSLLLDGRTMDYRRYEFAVSRA